MRTSQKRTCCRVGFETKEEAAEYANRADWSYSSDMPFANHGYEWCGECMEWHMGLIPNPNYKKPTVISLIKRAFKRSYN